MVLGEWKPYLLNAFYNGQKTEIILGGKAAMMKRRCCIKKNDCTFFLLSLKAIWTHRLIKDQLLIYASQSPFQINAVAARSANMT